MDLLLEIGGRGEAAEPDVEGAQTVDEGVILQSRQEQLGEVYRANLGAGAVGVDEEVVERLLCRFETPEGVFGLRRVGGRGRRLGRRRSRRGDAVARGRRSGRRRGRREAVGRGRGLRSRVGRRGLSITAQRVVRMRKE